MTIASPSTASGSRSSAFANLTVSRRAEACVPAANPVNPPVSTASRSRATSDLGVLEDIITRCGELGLRLAVPEEQARVDFVVLLTVQTMNYLHSGRHRLAV